MNADAWNGKQRERDMLKQMVEIFRKTLLMDYGTK